MQIKKKSLININKKQNLYGKLAFFNSFFLASFPVKNNFRIRMHDILSDKSVNCLTNNILFSSETYSNVTITSPDWDLTLELRISNFGHLHTYLSRLAVGRILYFIFLMFSACMKRKQISYLLH